MKKWTRWHCTSHRSANVGLGVLYEPRPYAGVQKLTAQIGPWAIVIYREREGRWDAEQVELLRRTGMTLLRASNRRMMQEPPV
jgi:hypothetical protein